MTQEDKDDYIQEKVIPKDFDFRVTEQDIMEWKNEGNKVPEKKYILKSIIMSGSLEYNFGNARIIPDENEYVEGGIDNIEWENETGMTPTEIYEKLKAKDGKIFKVKTNKKIFTHIFVKNC